jgi:hypothetical protein
MPMPMVMPMVTAIPNTTPSTRSSPPRRAAAPPSSTADGADPSPGDAEVALAVSMRRDRRCFVSVRRQEI